MKTVFVLAVALFAVCALGQAPGDTVNTTQLSPTPVPSQSAQPTQVVPPRPQQPQQQPQVNQASPAAGNTTTTSAAPAKTVAAPPSRVPARPNTGTQPNTAPPRAPPTPANRRDLYAIISTSPVHKVLTSIIKYANMTAVIRQLREVTFFAPTDEGFHLTLRDLRYKREGDPTAVSEFWIILLEDQKALLDVRKLLLYHVLPGRRNRAQLNPPARTAEHIRRTAANVDVRFESDGLRDRAQAMPNPNYTQPLNVVASNGNLHSLDRVLIPVNIDRAAVSARTKALAERFSPSNKRNICFPISSMVHTTNGVIRMGSLRAGTSIRVSEHAHIDHSSVFLFTHRRLNGVYKFVRLTTLSGHSITLSPSHYLYANKRLTAASAVTKGDLLRTISGVSRVVKITEVEERGLIAPHTIHGDIVVDGIVASSYTQAVHPRIAQIVLAPIRAVVRLGLAREPLGGLFYDGADHLVPYIPSGPRKY